ncbi:hypothetical protein AB4254_08115 [Vibrio breoganii]
MKTKLLSDGSKLAERITKVWERAGGFGDAEVRLDDADGEYFKQCVEDLDLSVVGLALKMIAVSGGDVDALRALATDLKSEPEFYEAVVFLEDDIGYEFSEFLDLRVITTEAITY